MTAWQRERAARDKRLALYQKLALIALGMTVFVLLLPGDLVLSLKQWVLAILPWDARPSSSTNIPTDKLIHAGLFCLCGALLMRGWWVLGKAWWWLFGILFLVAITTELLQQLVPGRGLEPMDILADIFGAVLGMMMARQYLLMTGIVSV